MAISKNNVITHGLSGKVGDLVVFRQRFGKTLLGKIPYNAGEPTAAQKEVRQKFLQAVSYAKLNLANPDIKALYGQKVSPGITAYNLAIADFFTAPVIDDINASAYSGAVGSKIQVQATDNFMVKTVEVTITAPDGSLIEKGNAVPDASNQLWVYTATAVNGSLAGSKLTVVAMDHPGNSATVVKTL